MHRRGLPALRLASLAVACALGPAASAQADAIGPPPADCVEGSGGDSCHGGPYCRARGCVGPGDCMIGERCAARDLCAYTFDCFWDTVPAVSGACDATGACAAGSTCTSLFVCVPAPPLRDAGSLDAGPGRLDAGRPDAPGTSADAGSGDRYRTSYCGCSVPSRHAAPGWLAGGALALVLGLGARGRARHTVARPALHRARRG